MNILTFLLALGILYFGWMLMANAGLKGIICSRSFSRRTVFEGESAELVEVVRNDQPYLIPRLRLESRIYPYIRLGKLDNLHVSDDMYYCSLFTLMPYQQIRRTHKVHFLRRGAYDLGNASLTVGVMLGVGQKQRVQELHAPVLVYPKLLQEDAIGLPISMLLGDLIRRQQLLTDPFLIRGIRDYHPGDPVRSIHWPASARMPNVQLRVHDHTARTKLLVVLNVQDQDLIWGNRISEQKEAAVEYGISLAATVCTYALQHGLCAGFAANMPLQQEKESTLILPQDGSGQDEILLAAMAKLSLSRTVYFPAFLESLNVYSGMDILVLSMYECDKINAAMEHLRHCGNQVTFHLLEGGGL